MLIPLYNIREKCFFLTHSERSLKNQVFSSFFPMNELSRKSRYTRRQPFASAFQRYQTIAQRTSTGEKTECLCKIDSQMFTLTQKNAKGPGMKFFSVLI